VDSSRLHHDNANVSDQLVAKGKLTVSKEVSCDSVATHCSSLRGEQLAWGIGVALTVGVVLNSIFWHDLWMKAYGTERVRVVESVKMDWYDDPIGPCPWIEGQHWPTRSRQRWTVRSYDGFQVRFYDIDPQIVVDQRLLAEWY